PVADGPRLAALPHKARLTMRKILWSAAVAALVCVIARPTARADDKDPKAILDKAIKALGGEENLAKAKAATWKAKGKISFGGNDNEFTSKSTIEGLDHYRSEFEGEFGGNKVQGVTVLAGDKGWRTFGAMTMDLAAAARANEKRNVYLQVAPVTILPLKDKRFKAETAAECKADGKPLVSVKVTGPDGKDFTIYFDKETGLPAKLTAK